MLKKSTLPHVHLRNLTTQNNYKAKMLATLAHSVHGQEPAASNNTNNDNTRNNNKIIIIIITELYVIYKTTSRSHIDYVY